MCINFGKKWVEEQGMRFAGTDLHGTYHESVYGFYVDIDEVPPSTPFHLLYLAPPLLPPRLRNAHQLNVSMESSSNSIQYNTFTSCRTTLGRPVPVTGQHDHRV